jgi:hypothetical protein
MKSLTSKILISTCLILSTVAADAAWQCKAGNARGQVWTGIAAYRAGAASAAMRFCARGSRYARNCHIKFCSPMGGHMPMMGWQCNVRNARGQLFVGTANYRGAAVATAMRFCARNSKFARNCQVARCFHR